MNRTISVILTCLFIVFIFPPTALSQKQNERSVVGNSVGIKAYFDIKADSAAKIEKRLVWINEMYEQMSQEGLNPSIIIGFRSEASFFVTREDDDLEEEDLPYKRKIEKWLKRFAERGIPIEQCGLSADLYEIDPQDFLPELVVIENGYMSLIKYQNNGYAYVPM